MVISKRPIVSCCKNHQVSSMIKIKIGHRSLESNVSYFILLNEVPEINLSIASSGHNKAVNQRKKRCFVYLINLFWVWLSLGLCHIHKGCLKTLLTFYLVLICIYSHLFWTLVKTLNCIELSLMWLWLICAKKAFPASRKNSKLLRQTLNDTIGKIWV